MENFKGPAYSEIKQFIKDKSLIEFHTIDGKTIQGTILWNDDAAFHICFEDKSEITLIKSAVIYYKKI